MMFAGQGSGLIGGARHQVRRRSSRLVALTVVVALSLAASACSSGTPTINKAVAKTQVTASYDSLFHLTTGSIASKEADVQNGTTIKKAMSQAMSSSIAGSAKGAKVHTVDFLSSAACTKESLPNPCAKVKYDILGQGGTAILAGNTGYAVLDNGKWVVAKATICTLLGLFYTAEGMTGSPPGC
jgi:hypothetical protein